MRNCPKLQAVKKQLWVSDEWIYTSHWWPLLLRQQTAQRLASRPCIVGEAEARLEICKEIYKSYLNVISSWSQVHTKMIRRTWQGKCKLTLSLTLGKCRNILGSEYMYIYRYIYQYLNYIHTYIIFYTSRLTLTLTRTNLFTTDLFFSQQPNNLPSPLWIAPFSFDFARLHKALPQPTVLRRAPV